MIGRTHGGVGAGPEPRTPGAPPGDDLLAVATARGGSPGFLRLLAESRYEVLRPWGQGQA